MVLRDFGSLLTLVFALDGTLFIMVNIVSVVDIGSADFLGFLLDDPLVDNLV
jgi:hypothetical protein